MSIIGLYKQPEPLCMTSPIIERLDGKSPAHFMYAAVLLGVDTELPLNRRPFLRRKWQHYEPLRPIFDSSVDGVAVIYLCRMTRRARHLGYMYEDRVVPRLEYPAGTSLLWGRPFLRSRDCCSRWDLHSTPNPCGSVNVARSEKTCLPAQTGFDTVGPLPGDPDLCYTGSGAFDTL